MITIGIDSGSRYTKAVALVEGKIAGTASVLTDFDADRASTEAQKLVLAAAQVTAEQVAAVVATGIGRSSVKFAQDTITEVNSAARGARFINANIHTIIDLGAEGSRVIGINPDGRVANFGTNDKCASGAGSFIEAMARALQVKPEEMGPLSLRHTQEVTMDTQCVVFAESEVISLVHQQTVKEDIAYAIHEGLASRIGSIVRRVGSAKEIAMIGGPSHNIGLVESLQKNLNEEIIVPENSEYISALGAALYGIGITDAI